MWEIVFIDDTQHTYSCHIFLSKYEIMKRKHDKQISIFSLDGHKLHMNNTSALTCAYMILKMAYVMLILNHLLVSILQTIGFVFIKHK